MLTKQRHFRPFDVGFEALGQIVATGDQIPKDKIGSYVLVS